jgi:hypothetical protein
MALYTSSDEARMEPKGDEQKAPSAQTGDG